jgi:hypothetical protein
MSASRFGCSQDDINDLSLGLASFDSKARDMLHRSCSAVFFLLTSFALFSAVGAQQPSADAAKEQSGQSQSQSQPQAKQVPPAENAPASDQSSTPSPPAAASDSKPTAGSSQTLTTIVVNGGPSPDILRSARNAGFTIKIANGTTHFCKSEAPVGTRFVSESCMNEQQVTLWLSRARDQRDTLTHLLGAPAASH